MAQTSEAVGRQHQPAVRLARKTHHSRINVGAGSNWHRSIVHAESRRSGINHLHEELGLWRCVGIEHNRHPRKTGCCFLEQVKPFATNRKFIRTEPGDTAAWPLYARNEALCDR